MKKIKSSRIGFKLKDKRIISKSYLKNKTMSREKRKVTLIYSKNRLPLMRDRKVQPNDKCICGSGKKAKKCCGCDSDYHEK